MIAKLMLNATQYWMDSFHLTTQLLHHFIRPLALRVIQCGVQRVGLAITTKRRTPQRYSSKVAMTLQIASS